MASVRASYLVGVGGVRLARTLAVQQLNDWCGVANGSETAHAVAVVTAA
ncbi:hypothetical protein [Streptomyces sp. NPDC046939]